MPDEDEAFHNGEIYLAGPAGDMQVACTVARSLSHAYNSTLR
jgi:hypothetical protein